MLKYAGVAAASKGFSASAPGRRLYRRLGNVALERSRRAEGLPQRYLDRAERLLALCETYDVLAPGDRVLELGTGWVHWEATVLALHHDVSVTLFDVCDNRLLGAYRTYLAGYRAHLAAAPDGDGTRRALDRLDAALAADDFAGIYRVLGFDHVIEPSGHLDGLDAGAYALEVSADVLEHVPAGMLAEYLDEAHALLRPGGHAIHQIDLADHYHYFDPSMSPKHYYRYSDTTWRRWFENDVQYFNRVQRPEWRALFAGAGFGMVEDDDRSLPPEELTRLDAAPTAAPFDALSDEDRACLQMLTVHAA
ncbi:SAM-dependent methyltransferase [Actinomycetospora flava]|uniref:Methyltransferase domain-containing protein n=1 Tax=Actinomycetospora flava TaxID=3129232 RepID=A0ABU8MAW4_9PSEU